MFQYLSIGKRRLRRINNSIYPLFENHNNGIVVATRSVWIQNYNNATTFRTLISNTVVKTLIIRCHTNTSTIIPSRRLLSTAATSTTTASTFTKKVETAKAAKSNNIFLDNIGSIFLSFIGLIIGGLIRNHYGTTNKTAIRDKIEETSVIDPFELYDLRISNQEFGIPLFQQIVSNIITAAAATGGRTTNDNLLVMTYDEFVAIVRKTMIQYKNDPTFTIQNGYLLDRVVAGSVATANNSNNNENDNEMTKPVLFWLTVLSMALNSTASERMDVLFHCIQQTKQHEQQQQRAADIHDDTTIEGEESVTTTTSTNTDRITLHDVKEMVQYLQDTCQLVPDAQVVATSTKYPVQQYERGTPDQLIQWGEKNSSKDDDDNKKIASSSSTTAAGENDPDDDKIDLVAFRAILCSKSVCAWGECYHKK